MKKRKAAVLAAAAFAMTAAFFLNGIRRAEAADNVVVMLDPGHDSTHTRSEEHTSELQSHA